MAQNVIFHNNGPDTLIIGCESNDVYPCWTDTSILYANQSIELPVWQSHTSIFRQGQVAWSGCFVPGNRVELYPLINDDYSVKVMIDGNEIPDNDDVFCKHLSSSKSRSKEGYPRTSELNVVDSLIFKIDQKLATIGLIGVYLILIIILKSR